MDFIENLLDKIKEWAQRLIDIVLGPDAEPEAELIPIPVRDRHRH